MNTFSNLILVGSHLTGLKRRNLATSDMQVDNLYFIEKGLTPSSSSTKSRRSFRSLLVGKQICSNVMNT